jgi:hypothetical protein
MPEKRHGRCSRPDRYLVLLAVRGDESEAGLNPLQTCCYPGRPDYNIKEIVYTCTMLQDLIKFTPSSLWAFIRWICVSAIALTFYRPDSSYSARSAS